jgi:DNA adenine methylase
MTSEKNIRPFLKWAGNKFKVLPTIIPLISHGERLIEPFIGSGSLMINRPILNYVGGDINGDLISVFNFIKTEGQDFVEVIRPLFSQEEFGTDGEANFYERRAEFNETTDLRRKAALFIYLNQHCFNGLCRYNRHGKFTTPYNLGFKHKGKPAAFAEERFLYAHEMSNSAQFVHASFEELMITAKRGDVIYCDPPYLPQDDKLATFVQYAKGEFSIEQQTLLANLADELRNVGVTTVISNHNSSLAKELYATADETMTFDVSRSMGRYKDHENAASEILAVFKAK